MVDIKCSFPKTKYKKQERTSSQDDESLLRQPTRTFCAGFREAKKAYESGTDEVRQLLMQECNLIYECNICRNMFRNLSNFICHKRKYCDRKTGGEANFSPDRERKKFAIQTVERSQLYPVKSRSTDSSPISTASNRDIFKGTEKLKHDNISNDLRCSKTLLNEKEEKLCSSELEVSNPILDLESVMTQMPTTIETLENHKKEDSIKTELDKVKNLLENQNIFFGPDGKLISPASTPFTSPTVIKAKLPEISCEICKIQFNTEKLLKMHVENNHTSTTYVFQCPTCTMTFLQPAAVIRHLANEHRKPLRRIRKMRDTILKKKVQIGNVQIKGMSRELKSLELNNTKDNYNNQQGERCISSCSYCFKNFDKRNAMATHLINCWARNESLDKRDQRKDEAKLQNQISNNKNERILSDEVTLNMEQEPEGLRNSPNINNSNTINKMFENLENQTFGNGLHTVCLENIEMMVDLNESSIEGHEDTKVADSKFRRNEIDEKKVNTHDSHIRLKSNKRGNTKRFRVVSASKQLTCRCKICSKQFNALSNLRRHISMFHYRSKRFGCNLCDYRAFRRYDIVNHLTFVHKMTGERESMAIEYVTVHEIKYSKNDVEGDIVLINEDAIANECKRNNFQRLSQEQQIFIKANKKDILSPQKDSAFVDKMESIDMKVKSQVKVVRKKLKNTLETQVEGKIRPIRNRTKTVNKDFVYDLLTIKEEPKHTTRLAFKRSNTDQTNLQKVELTPPPLKIIPYRLRTEPLIPVNKSSVRGVAENVSRNVIHAGLGAPSTLPELPTERPQMRSRLISASRTDLNIIPVIESSELEAAGFKSTFFDDSFLEKFAKKSNPSFKMKPLLGMQHSPLNSILQKFDGSQHTNTKLTENDCRIPSSYSICLLESLTLPSLKDKDVTPNSKQMFKPSSPPAPRKRITLMERLAENRAKRRDSLIHTAFDN